MKIDGDTPEQSDDGLKQIIAELTERNKELHCLFSISRIIEQHRHSLEKTLQEVVDVLPSAWQNPQSTCAQIIFDNQIVMTDNFVETAWRQTCDLLVKGTPAGSVVICRLGNRIESNGATFLKEETDLLRAVAERLGKMIERRQAESALQISEQRFRNLVENSITGISIVQHNQIIYQNQEQEKLLGPLPRSFVLGNLENIHPDDVETVLQANHDIQIGKVPKQDLDFRLYPASGDRNLRVLKRVFCRMMFIDYQGRESVLVNMIDMTKSMELEQLLFRQDKMASLGRVAAGIAHEIRNPLSGINIYLDALEKLVDRPDSRPKVVQVIDQLQSASRKIESVIKKVMDFAKPGKPNFVHIQINKPVEDALNLTAVTMRKSGIAIEKEFADNIPNCYADPHLIEEAVLNLINNAAEAMRKMDAGKKIAIRTGVAVDHVFIKVSDSGPGVPMELKNKVFDPFFTTKNDGTGIGLSLCHRIATDHNGALAIDKGILGGAEFRLEIPIRKDAHSSD
ncbi:MAG: ATP-binding protein [Desulfobacterales bacterium]|nr:ATP-binding protein [Desulfobacterales bacterium]MDX2512540.1 ATP-binding protein [Desulfobacterales bacterium]